MCVLSNFKTKGIPNVRGLDCQAFALVYSFNIKLIFLFLIWQGNSRFSPNQFPYKLKCAEPNNHIHRFHGTL